MGEVLVRAVIVGRDDKTVWVRLHGWDENNMGLVPPEAIVEPPPAEPKLEPSRERLIEIIRGLVSRRGDGSINVNYREVARLNPIWPDLELLLPTHRQKQIENLRAQLARLEAEEAAGA